MNLKLSLFTVLAVLLSACGNQATGQKEHTVELKSTRDSVSYGIGSDVGHNLQMNLKQYLEIVAFLPVPVSSIRDDMTSTERISNDKVKAIVQDYMMQAQKPVMAKQQAQADASLAAGKAFLAENGKKPGVTTTASGLQYEVLQMGKGPKPVATDSVTVNYKGTLLNGKEFDSSYKHGQPATFSLQDVVPGWAEAVELMPVGSRFKVYIPSELGWGERGAGQDIPGNNVVVFELELLSIPTNK